MNHTEYDEESKMSLVDPAVINESDENEEQFDFIQKKNSDDEEQLPSKSDVQPKKKLVTVMN